METTPKINQSYILNAKISKKYNYTVKIKL